MRTFRFFILAMASLAIATAQVFLPVPNARLMKQDSVDPSQMWLAFDGMIQRGAIPTKSSPMPVPTFTATFTGRPTCLTITATKAVMQLSNLNGSLATNSMVVIDIATGLSTYSDLEIAVTNIDGGKSPFYGGGCGANSVNSLVLLGNNTQTLGSLSLHIPKLALLDPDSGSIQYYDTDNGEEVTAINPIGGTKAAVTYSTGGLSPNYSVAIVDTANMEAYANSVTFIPVVFPVTAPPAFADGKIYFSGGGSVGAVVNAQTLNITNVTHGFASIIASSGDSYVYVAASNLLAAIDATNWSPLLPEVDFNGYGTLLQLIVVRDPDLDIDHIIILSSDGWLILTDQKRPPIKVNDGGVVNSFSYKNGSITGNEWISIFGTNLGKTPFAATTVPLSNQLNGTTFTVQCQGADPVSMALNFVGPKQINALTPPTLSAASCPQATLVATTTFADGSSTSSQPVQLQVAASAPGLDQDSQGNVVVVHTDGTINTEATGPGEVIMLFGVGLGQTQFNQNDGLYWTVQMPQITINGVSADVLFSGLCGTFDGLYQVNVQVPQTTSGNLVIQIDGGTSTAKFLIGQ